MATAAIAGLYGLIFVLVGLVIGSMRQASTLRVAVAQLEGKIGELRGDVGELRGDMEALRSGFQAEFAKIRQEMATTAADLAGEMRQVRERLVKLGG